MKIYENNAECCGCSACESVCPQKIIKMLPTEYDGFSYPVIEDDDKCLGCNLCVKVCPMKHPEKQECEKSFYAGITNDKNIWKESTSGGVFTEICKLYSHKNPVIFGARWDEKIEVLMDYCEGVNLMTPFRKSKYVAAKSNGMFYVAKRFLEEGRVVIFSGTPCQIAGLKNYLRKDYDNLVTIDFACHGQGSPLVFDKWKKHLEKKYKSKLTRFKFRERKYIGDFLNSNCTGYEFENGKQVTVNRDYYHHAFVYGFHMRECCGSCKFSKHLYADITLADFKSPQQSKFIDSHENATDVVANTDKGKTICNSLKETIRMFDANYTEELRYNPKLYMTLNGNPERVNFMKDINKGIPVDTVIKKYAMIMPTQWGGYNLPLKYYRILWPLLRVMDTVVNRTHKLIRKLL